MVAVSFTQLNCTQPSCETRLVAPAFRKVRFVFQVTSSDDSRLKDQSSICVPATPLVKQTFIIKRLLIINSLSNSSNLDR